MDRCLTTPLQLKGAAMAGESHWMRVYDASSQLASKRPKCDIPPRTIRLLVDKSTNANISAEAGSSLPLTPNLSPRWATLKPLASHRGTTQSYVLHTVGLRRTCDSSSSSSVPVGTNCKLLEVRISSGLLGLRLF